jgi:CMP-N-acetylneuraminic acid synthetase
MTRATLRVLGLIPARGGSKGVPRKNVRLLRGKPLVQYTIEAAAGALRLAHTILSTDDEEIAAVGRACGVDVPFIRPATLAGDAAPMLPVVQHALAWFEQRGTGFDAVCLLQPTNPLRPPALIDRCIERLEESGADSVVTILPVPAEYNPHWVYFQDAAGALRLSTGEATPIARRQDLPAAFHRDGSVYVARSEVVANGSLYGPRTVGVVVAPEDSVNIDEPADWDLADARLAARGR